MAVTEQLILDLSRAQAQIRDLDRELDSLLKPVQVPVELDASDDIARLRRDLASVDATVDIDVSGLQAIDEAADDANRLEQEFSQARAEAAKVADQADRIKRELREADNATVGFGGRVGEIATALAAFQGARAAFDFLSEGVQDAAALGESINQVNVLLGESAASVIAFSESSNAALVLTQQEVLAAVGRFAGLANTVGLTQDQAATFGTTLTDLAADLASFKDTSVDEAVQALGSALIGESEPLRRYDVLLNESAVSAKAYELGLAGATGELSEAAKVQARYALILEQTVPAQGDLADTAESLGNRLKATRRDFLEFRKELGEAVVPAVEDLLEVLPGVIDLFGSVAPAVGTAASEFGNLVTPIAELAGIFSDVSGPLSELSGLLGEAGEAGGFLAEAGEGIKRSFFDALNPIAPVLREINRAYREAFPATVENPLVEGFRELQDLGVRGLGDVSVELEEQRTQTLLAEDAVAGLVDGYRQLAEIGSAGIGDTGTALERTTASALVFITQLRQLESVGAGAFGPLESELNAIGQAFADTFDPDKNGDVIASVDELIEDIRTRFAEAGEFESGLAELTRRGFDDAAAIIRERGPEAIGLLREALADPTVASELESVLDGAGTSAGAGYVEGFAIGVAAESLEIATALANSVDNASVRAGIIAGAKENALLYAANFDPKLLASVLVELDISNKDAAFVNANVGPGSDLLGGSSNPTAQGSARGFTVNIVNPTVTDLDTSVGQATSTLGAISGLVS
jgi:hypothetical protein